MSAYQSYSCDETVLKSVVDLHFLTYLMFGFFFAGDVGLSLFT